MQELAPREQRKGKRRRGPRINTNQLDVRDGGSKTA